MSEARWAAEDIADGGPLGGGPEKLVERIQAEHEAVVRFIRKERLPSSEMADAIERGDHRK